MFITQRDKIHNRYEATERKLITAINLMVQLLDCEGCPLDCHQDGTLYCEEKIREQINKNTKEDAKIQIEKISNLEQKVKGTFGAAIEDTLRLTNEMNHDIVLQRIKTAFLEKFNEICKKHGLPKQQIHISRKKR